MKHLAQCEYATLVKRKCCDTELFLMKTPRDIWSEISIPSEHFCRHKCWCAGARKCSSRLRAMEGTQVMFDYSWKVKECTSLI